MKNVKIDDKSKFYTAVLLVIVFIGLAYFLGYKKFEDRAAALNTENSNLRTKIATLETYYLTEEQNKKDTEKMTAEIGDILDEYSGDARFEDGIYEAYNLYDGSDESLTLEKIVFAANEVVKTIPAETVSAAHIEGLDSEIAFRRFNVGYQGAVSYEGLKGMVREIATGYYNLGIEKMKYKISETGFIEGNCNLSFYYISGAHLDYQEPPVASYDTGLENLFGVNGADISTVTEEEADAEEN